MLLIFFLLLTLKGFAENYCYFIPPPGWSIADPAKLSPRVKICFLGNSSKRLAPSINLATEKVNISLHAYLAAIKKLHEADPSSRFRDLGSYYKEDRLIEIESKTPCGTIRRLQLIVLKNGVAYVLTVGALKEEFAHHHKTFERTLNSLTFTDDLISELPEKKAALMQLIEHVREAFIRSCQLKPPRFNPFSSQRCAATLRIDPTSPPLSFFQEKIWRSFQHTVIHDFPELGPYWQALLLQQVQSRLISLI